MTLINLNKDLKGKNFSKKSGLSKKAFIRLVIIVLALFLLIGLPIRSAVLASRELAANSKVLLYDAKLENLDQMKISLAATHTSIKKLQYSLDWLMWMRFVPFAGGYYSDARRFIKAADFELDALGKVINILDPYKNELGLTGQVTAGQDRIAQVVKIMDKVLPQIDEIEPSLKNARAEVEPIDIAKYPEKIKGITLRSKLDTAKNGIIGLDILVSDNRELINLLPSVLGEPDPKNYLLLFQNDKELRPTGGFMTAYAFLRLDKGKLTTTTSDDIYRLDEKLLKVCLNKICPLTPPEPVVKYLPEVDGKPRKAWSMRDSNISPDLPTAGAEFERMYELLGEGLPFDGIIYIDTQVVEELIAVTGPIDVFGTNYSAETDKRCNCPNVIYELEHYAEVASKEEQDRKAILGTLMQQLLGRSLGAGPDKAPELINTGIKLANDKHFMFYMHDPKLQAALAKLNWTGQIAQTDSDYFYINDSNFAGGKSNLYVEEKVTLDININSQGNVKKNVSIEYKNPQPYNIWLNGILRNYVRLYVPSGSSLVNSKGSQDPVKSHDDEVLNKTYFDGFVVVRPQNSLNLSYEYISSYKAKGKTYSLLIQKQPGAKDHHYVVKINGKTKAEFDLNADKRLELDI